MHSLFGRWLHRVRRALAPRRQWRLREVLLAAGTLGGITELHAASAEDSLAEYFRAQTRQIADHTFDGLDSRAAWEARREGLRRDLLDMLGLWPLPQRTDLRATVTGTIDRGGLVVERLHFQSLTGLYVTANLYRPREVAEPLPAILYVCGHAQVKTNGVSCGNKTAYQHHGVWLARHGFVCLMIDSVQLGEIEGLHHGTYRYGQWWWNSRGYSPAGVEAWNSIRALDYLATRPEVDARRLGMTGRSGGGSYSWTTAAIDERVRVAAPVAGITDLENQVVDGVVEGHCDCMFFVNTHRWDFALNAALVAPRPLLFVNTDADTIFPLDGVQRVHRALEHIYEAYGARTNLGLVIAPGPHQDTQDLQVPVFRWFQEKLQGVRPLVDEPALPMFTPLELRVFTDLPADQRNTEVQQWFGSAPTPPASAPADLASLRQRLRERTFAGWPAASPPLRPTLLNDVRPDPAAPDLRVREWSFESQEHVPLRLIVVSRGEPASDQARVEILDAESAARWDPAQAATWLPAAAGNASVPLVLLAPRGIGAGAWTATPAKQIQIRRRFMLLGQTLDGMRVWDIRRGLELVRTLLPEIRQCELAATGPMGVNAVYAAVEDPRVRRLDLARLPASFREEPDYLNVLQVTDLPTTLDLLRRDGREIRRRE